MGGACIDLELADLCPAQPGLGKHAADRVPHGIVRASRQFGAVTLAVQTAGVTGMPMHLLGLGFVGGEHNLVSVDDHYMVACVNVGRKGGLVLASQQSRDFGGEPAQHHAFGINKVPATLDFRGFGCVGGHAGSQRFRALIGSFRPAMQAVV